MKKSGIWIVIVVFGFLGVYALMDGRLDDAQDASRAADTVTLANAASQYHADGGVFDVDLPQCTDFVDVPSEFEEVLVPTYLAWIPVDTETGSPYQVCEESNGTYTFLAPDAEGREITATSR